MNKSPATTIVNINRTLIGVIALVLLFAAAVLWTTVGSQNLWTGACVKVGLVMSTLWLAMPSGPVQGNWGQASLGSIVVLLSIGLILIGKRVDFRIVVAVLFGAAVTIKLLRPGSKHGVR